jgi:hypothetical protein
VVVELPDLDPIESMERFGERKGTVPAPSSNNREGLSRARITLVPDRGPQGWASLAPSRLLARFDGPIQFFGFRTDRTVRAGADLPVTLFWWLSSQSGIVGPVPTFRLVDANGQAYASEDPGRSLPAVEEGDWVVVRRERLAVPARVPPGQYTLELVLSTDVGQPIRRADQPAATLPLTSLQVIAR